MRLKPDGSLDLDWREPAVQTPDQIYQDILAGHSEQRSAQQPVAYARRSPSDTGPSHLGVTIPAAG
jgi:hypothetical protein